MPAGSTGGMRACRRTALARGESPAAFDWRCTRSTCVVPRSNAAGILPRHASPDRRFATLGATRDFHHGLLALLLLPLLTVALHAQATGTLTGTVRTAAGDPVSDAVLTITGLDTQVRPVTARTDMDGDYRLSLLAGRYTLTIDAPPFVLEPGVEVGVIAEITIRRDLTLRDDATDDTPGWRADQLLEASPGLSARVLDLIDVERRDTFAQLLQQVPGITVSRAGGVGQPSSVRVRGVEVGNRFALADGLPLDDLDSLLADRGPFAPARVEVVRSNPSSRFGGDLAGAAHRVTGPAGDADARRLAIAVEGGDLRWRRVAATTAGRQGTYDWSAGAQHLETTNQQPNSAFSQRTVEGTFGATRDTASAHLFFRGETSTAGLPGQTILVAADQDAREKRTQFLLGATLRLRRGQSSEHEVRVVASQTERRSLNPVDSGTTDLLSTIGDIIRVELLDFPDQSGLRNDLRAARMAYEYTLRVDEFHLVSGGFEVEGQSGRFSRDGTAIERLNLALYGDDRINMLGNLTVTVGGRVERNGPYGFAAMPRGSALWDLGPWFTVHGSGGFGVATPTLEQRFGATFEHRGNPDLALGRSITFDGGIRRSFWANRVRVDVTAYRHDYEDLPVLDEVELPNLESLVEFQRLTLAQRSQLRQDVRNGLREPFTVTPTFDQTRTRWMNLPRSRAHGVELTIHATPTPQINVGAVYTFTDSRVTDGTSLIRKGRLLPDVPRHHGTLTGDVRVGRVALGGSLRYVGSRTAGVNFIGHALGLGTLEAFTRWDVRGAVRLWEALDISFTGENLTDAVYQEVLGYASLGRLIRAGLHFNF